MILLIIILHRWVDPEFENEEDVSREMEAVTGEVEEVEDNRGMVNNCNSKEEEKIVVDVEMEDLQLLKAKK